MRIDVSCNFIVDSVKLYTLEIATCKSRDQHIHSGWHFIRFTI